MVYKDNSNETTKEHYERLIEDLSKLEFNLRLNNMYPDYDIEKDVSYRVLKKTIALFLEENKEFGV